MQKTIQLSLISVALLSQLSAQEAITLKPIAITSTAIATDELKSTDAVEVYTQEDIEKAHVQNVYEFLNSQTSVVTTPSYGNPFAQLVDVHGYGTSNGHNNVVITINGRKLNNVDNVPQLLASISPSSISRVEIIKSGGIVSYGDGANAGVINITTKQTNETEVSFYAGAYNAFDGAFYTGYKGEKLSVSANAEAFKTGGTRTVNANGDKDESSITTGSVNLEYKATQDLNLRAGASFSRTDVVYGGVMTQAQYESKPYQFAGYTANLLFDTNSMSLGATYDVSDNLSFKIDTNNERKVSDYKPSYGSSNYDYDSLKASLNYVGEVMALTFGYDGFYGDRAQNQNVTSKNNNAAFAMSEFYLGSHTLKAGYRYEKVSYEYKEAGENLKQDDSLNGVELGYNYAFDKEKSVFLNYAHSYQSPVVDMFFATVYAPPTYAPVTSFNSFIKPMKADSVTLGLNQIQADNKLKVSIYYVSLNDEIYLYKNLGNPYDFGTNTNIDKSSKYGLDFYDKYLVSDEFNVAINYNYVQAIIDEEKGLNGEDYAGNSLPGVSAHNARRR